ncbi:hypothetical protein PIB30_106020 [Stylosanthes scabra]|uniref:Pentatricopeptide repeat-containing protein n=1 Tax=Stylosanthes scabra TaxID=79078 RepID=A0ABU6YWG5_9FABA|nr:hypothetical protein [Stylosanthes scabra]
MDVLFRIGQPNLALRVFHHTQAPNFFTFNYALCHLSKLNDITHTGYVFRLMLRMGYYPNFPMFEMLLNCFSRMNRLLQVYQVLGLMISLGFQMSVNVWTILIHTYCKLGRLDIASNLLLRMAGSGCSPNVVTYTILFKGFMQSGMVTDALDLLTIMLSTGQNPDLILCNVLIDCLSKAGRYQDAIEVFAGLSKRNIKPDSYTFTSMLSTICLSGKFYLLPQLLCVYVDTDLVLYNALLCTFVKAGHPSHSVEIYNNLVDNGFTPDKYTFAGLLNGLFSLGRIEEAVYAYRGLAMSYHDVDAHIHTAITGGLVKEMIDFRVELSDRNFLNICELPCGSDTYFSLLNLLSKMRESELLSAKVLHSLILDVQSEGEQAKEKVYAKSESERSLISYSSSSEDLSDIAAVC